MEGTGERRAEPGDSGIMSQDWLVTLLVVRRSDERVVITGAITRDDGSPGEPVRVAIEDVTDSSTLSQWGDVTERGCGPQQIFADRFNVDFLWVVDDTASMIDDRDAVADAAELFFDSLQRSLLSFRIAVVSTQLTNDEWTIVEPGFSRFLTDFQEQIRRPPRQSGPPGSEFALETVINVAELADSGFADEATGWRSDARRIVVFFTDENDQTVKDEIERGNEACDATVTPDLEGCPIVDQALAVFEEQGITAYAITGEPPDGCTAEDGPGEAEEAGTAYIDLAFDTGGSYASICSEDLGETVDRIVRSSFGAASQYELIRLPISSTLRVVRNGELVPRSTVDGWSYDVRTNTVSFFGTARPNIDDELAIGYRYYLDETADPTGFTPGQ